MKFHSCKRTFTLRFQNCLLQAGVHGKLFHKFEISILIALSSSSRYSSTTNDVLPVLDKAKLSCEVGVESSVTTAPQPCCQLGSPTVDTAKLRIFDDDSDYSSPSPSALGPKFASVENLNAIPVCQTAALWGEKETLTWELGCYFTCRSSAPCCCFCWEKWLPSWQPG